MVTPMLQNDLDTKLAMLAEQGRQKRLSDREVLEELIVDNPDLEQLEALLDEFNIFEAIGVVKQELRHSDFLAYMLDPQQRHGLQDAFLKLLLQTVLLAHRKARLPVSLVDMDVWSLTDTLVLREWSSIDILLVSQTHGFAIIIENKIGTAEHSDQLRRYRETVQRYYPHLGVIALFLTRDGATPSHTDYLSVDYGQIVAMLDALVTRRASSLGADVRTLIVHYLQMLRWHIVSDSEIDDLCRRIYARHKRALDLIFDRRPDNIQTLHDFLRKQIDNTSSVVVDYDRKTYISFTLKDWDRPALLVHSPQWNYPRRVLLFQVWNDQNGMFLILRILPGPQIVRERLFDMARRNKPFKTAMRKLGDKYNQIYKRQIVSKAALEDPNMDQITAEIGRFWNDFIHGDLPAMSTILLAQDWLNEEFTVSETDLEGSEEIESGEERNSDDE
jgi:hypothetical protein